MEWLMKNLSDLDTSQKLKYVVGGSVMVAASAVVIKKMIHRKEMKNYPRDTVILHQVGRGPYAPSMGPFTVKLETYLRMARIPYQNVHGFQMSSKGKFPWIEYNGEAIADSSLCIDFLNKKIGIDLNKQLSPAEKGIAQSMQVLVEEHLYWISMIFRWQLENDKSMMHTAFKNASIFIWWSLKRNMLESTWAQGLGRHTEGEITQMMKKDLQAISAFLGQKKFIMGDEPSEADCAMFGQLCEFYWQFIDYYPNLAQYCERMKTTFWPDWDQCTTHGGTREATK